MNIQHALEMIGVESGMDNEQKSVCVRLKNVSNCFNFKLGLLEGVNLLRGQSPSFQLLRQPLQ